MIAQNPHYIPFLIQQLASARPELASRLASDPSSVLQILGGMEGEGDDGQGGELPPGVHAIHLTQDERAAITRVSPVIPSTLKGLIHSGLSSWRRTLGLRIKMQSRRIWRVTRMRNLLQIIFWTVISMIEAMSLVLPTPMKKHFLFAMLAQNSLQIGLFSSTCIGHWIGIWIYISLHCAISFQNHLSSGRRCDFTELIMRVALDKGAR